MPEPIKLQFIVDQVNTDDIRSKILGVLTTINSNGDAKLDVKLNTADLERQLTNVRNLLRDVGSASGSAGGSKNAFSSAVSGINRQITALEKQKFVTKEVAQANKELQATYNSFKAGNVDAGAMQKQVDATKSALASARDLKTEYSQCAKTLNEAKIAMEGAVSGSKQYEAALARATQADERMLEIENQLNVSRADMAQYTEMSVKQEQQYLSAVEKRAAAEKKAAQDAANAEQRRQQSIMQLESYYQRWGQNISKNTALQQRYNALLEQARAGKLDAASFTSFRRECKAAGVEVETLSQKLQKLMNTSFGSFIKSGLVMLGRRALRNAWEDVKKIDIAMTELKKVTDESNATYSRFLDGAGDRAKKYGATIEDVVQATAEFARLGYSLSEATDLGNAAIVLKNVGDGIEDISDAAEKLISTLKAFPEFEGNAMNIVDKMNEVGKQHCPAA